MGEYCGEFGIGCGEDDVMGMRVASNRGLGWKEHEDGELTV